MTADTIQVTADSSLTVWGVVVIPGKSKGFWRKLLEFLFGWLRRFAGETP